VSENAILANRIAELERQLSTAQEDARQQRDMKAKAREQRDAANAQLTKLRNAAIGVLEIKEPKARRKAFAILSVLVKSTSAVCLKQVKAEVVRDFIYWGQREVDPEFCEFIDCSEEFIRLGLPSLPREDDERIRQEVE